MTALIRGVEELLPDIKRIIENLKKKYIHTMPHITPEEKAAVNEVMQLLEAQPLASTSSTTLVSFDDQIPAQREKLAVLVSTGKSKEAIGVQLTHDQAKRLSDKDVQKYSKRYEAYIGNKTTDSLIDSFIMLFTKGVGMVVSIDDVKELQKELKNDYIINQELPSLAGGLALRFGRLLAPANTALITTKHITFEKEHEPTTLIKFEKGDAPLTHSSRDSKGYPLEGFDEVDKII